jgi:hypothetical protein
MDHASSLSAVAISYGYHPPIFDPLRASAQARFEALYVYAESIPVLPIQTYNYE